MKANDLTCFLKDWLKNSAVFIIVLTLVLVMIPNVANAAGNCSLTLTVPSDTDPLYSTQVSIYKVADIDGNNITLTSDFENSGVSIQNDMTSSELQAVASTLDAYLTANPDIQPAASAMFDDGRNATFSGLDPGMYLVVDTTESSSVQNIVATMLVTVTESNVTAEVKVQPGEPHQTPGGKDYRVIKEWAGDSDGSSRPTEVTVKIMKDGELYDTVTLNDDNNWMYEWTDEEGESTWTVVEDPVPTNYTYTMIQDEVDDTTVFTITNTYSGTHTEPPEPDNPDNPSKTTDNPENPHKSTSTNPPHKTASPRTGDPFNMTWVYLVMAACGAALIVTAVKRRHDE
ncbi:MAG: Cna B-type domain-containing protein [Anaerovoracaceae bacterium]|jgi:hypothetical protein